MIYLSYGMTKSASSFCFQLILDVLKIYAKRNGLIYCNVKDVLPGHKYAFYFNPEGDISLDVFLEKSLAMSEQGKCIAVKLHCGLTDYTKSLIENNSILANASFRHPADCVLSFMDAHKKETTEKRKQLRFLGGTHFETSLEVIKRQEAIFLEWAKTKNTLLIHFNELAFNPEIIVKKISRQIGVEIDAGEILKSFLDDKNRIWEFNKGIINRRFHELPQHQIQKVEEECQDLVRFIESYDQHSSYAKRL